MALWRNLLRKISAKVAAYSIGIGEIGTLFTNRGATASVTFTLPPTGDLQAGWFCEFFAVSDYGLIVASYGSSDNIVALNDAGADTITCETTSLMIGASVSVVWDGTGWLATLGDGPTYAIA